MASRCEDGAVTGDFLDELPNFHIVTFSELEEHSGRFAEVSESDVEKLRVTKSARDTNETIEFNQFFFQASFLQLQLSCEDYCVPWLHFTVVATYSNLMNITWFKRSYCKCLFLECTKILYPWMQTFKVPTIIQYYLP